MAKKQKSPDGGLSQSVTHLLHRVLQLALDYHAEASGPVGLTQRQYTVLAAAGAADGVSQSDLVRATGIDRSTLADLVARMISKGLLERERSATDARANTVRVSEAGKLALAEGGKPAARSDERLLDLLPPKKRESFVKTLTTLAAAADATAAPAKTATAPKAEKAKTKPAKAASPKGAPKKKGKKAKKQAKAAA
ncbi:MAG TPA: MarR family winged helix-turn-helix transcriptional regulator [Caulobacteraceae bacterium]|nr:MarR family winged helix-turn-helix transcriptional regulator [Caulobacteraceae bacterium]